MSKTVAEQIAAAQKRADNAAKKLASMQEKLLFRDRSKQRLAQLINTDTVNLFVDGYGKPVSFETIEKLYKWFKKHNRAKSRNKRG